MFQKRKETVFEIHDLPEERDRRIKAAWEKINSFCRKENSYIPRFRYETESKAEQLVSVIVPVYNSESSLIKTLDSIIHQTFSDIEIICVDDGSADASKEILDAFSELDSRIRILEQENKGGGAARNLGMKHASGKYFAFVDADDFCSRKMLANMVEQIQRNQADLVVTRRCNYDVTTGQYKEIPFPPGMDKLPNPFSSRQCRDHLYCLYNAPWGKLFSAEFIRKHDLRFQEIRNSNDLYFSMITLSLAERISLLDQPLYYYCSGLDESTQATKWRNPLLFLEALRKTENDLRRHGLYSVFESAFRESMLREFVFNLQTSKTEEAFRSIFQAAKQYFDAEFFSSFPESACLDRIAWQHLHDMMQFESPFQYLLDRYCRQVKILQQATSELENSRSYRIGQVITWLPRQIRNGIRIIKHKT